MAFRRRPTFTQQGHQDRLLITIDFFFFSLDEFYQTFFFNNRLLRRIWRISVEEIRENDVDKFKVYGIQRQGEDVRAVAIVNAKGPDTKIGEHI